MNALAASRWRSVAYVLLALAILYAMRATIPNYDGQMAPILVRGKAGEFVASRRFSARVDGVETAREVRFARIGARDDVDRRDTGGVWLIVRASAMATQTPLTINGADIVTRDGRRYQQSGRLYNAPQQLTSRELQPGVASEGVLLFELPADAVAGATLALTENRYLTMLDSELRIDLGLDKAPEPRDAYDLVRR